MSKFGLLGSNDDTEPAIPSAPSFSDKLAAFPRSGPKHVIDVKAMDAAAAPHGFVSREASQFTPVAQQGRRRRLLAVEPTRHLAIRLGSSQYDRFVAYADRHKLTYHEALVRLMEQAGD